MFYRDTIVAGNTIIRILKASSRKSSSEKKRAAKTHPTSDAVQKVNFRNAVKVLTAKINHNFRPGDYHLILTYANIVDAEAAKKSLEKFIRNVRGYCRKNNIDFKWVAVTEYKHTRVHHHLIVNKVDLEIIEKYWTQGFVNVKPLDSTGNYYKLAEYLLKETEKTFREDDSPSKRRYSCSRSVIMPEVKRERLAGREYYQDVKPPAGYTVDRDTVRKYEHAILGVDCMEYIMVNHDKNLKIDKWKKGKSVSIRESYKSYEKQLSFYDELEF